MPDPKPPEIDPTKNVLDLVAAAIERQDDLRKALEERLDTKIDGHMCLTKERDNTFREELSAQEKRRIEHKSDTEKAVKAAFDAAKEAVKEQAASFEKANSKSEKAAGDQLMALQSVVDDLKGRVGTVETQQQTKNEVRVDSRGSAGMVVAIVMGAIAFLSVIILAANFLSASR